MLKFQYKSAKTASLLGQEPHEKLWSWQLTFFEPHVQERSTKENTRRGNMIRYWFFMLVVEGKPPSGPPWFQELEKGQVSQYQTRKETFLKASFANILFGTHSCNAELRLNFWEEYLGAEFFYQDIESHNIRTSRSRFQLSKVKTKASSGLVSLGHMVIVCLLSQKGNLTSSQ